MKLKCVETDLIDFKKGLDYSSKPIDDDSLYVYAEDGSAYYAEKNFSEVICIDGFDTKFTMCNNESPRLVAVTTKADFVEYGENNANE